MAALAGALFVGQRASRRSGIAAHEARHLLPGDTILPAGVYQNDRAVWIDAPPAAIWPFLAQLGQEKAGFYSWEAVENAIGCEIENSFSINPEWQRVEVGDDFHLAPEVALRIAAVEPEKYLVVESPAGAAAPGGLDFDFTWSFSLHPVGSRTRLWVRERYLTRDTRTAAAVWLVSIGSAIMSHKMLTTIRDLAEASRDR